MMLESVPPYLYFLSLLEMVLNYCTSLKFAFQIKFLLITFLKKTATQ